MGKERWARAKKVGIIDEVVEEVWGQRARGQELAGAPCRHRDMEDAAGRRPRP